MIQVYWTRDISFNYNGHEFNDVTLCFDSSDGYELSVGGKEFDDGQVAFFGEDNLWGWSGFFEQLEKLSGEKQSENVQLTSAL